ncbi:cutinase family protein [Gordonia sp. (in: high G+C Gram-positive bacteria)]|uniref:cutinase family protein n=1 Tax=unclassified Gordonia (in: high G+C Gram-positive bacteria) TaxID=2657482 RepID=UPI002636204D|nr:cutinase family protein [Gordonia sp. (in: high G+C Gram-positive bacteria)]
MTARLLLVFSAFALLLGLAVPMGAGAAQARDCADVQLLFARGTAEAGAPVGTTGQAMYRSLQARFPGKDVRVSPVHYQASDQFQKGTVFLKSVAAGVRSAQNQMRFIADTCPKTRIVLGGYSQGAVVVTYAVSDQIAMIAPVLAEVPNVLSPTIAPHVAGVVTFGAPADRWFREVGVPPMRVGALYTAKTREYCIPGDNICDGGPVDRPNTVHGLYATNGMTDAAANFVARRIH